jgi:hypothetical protein
MISSSFGYDGSLSLSFGDQRRLGNRAFELSFIWATVSTFSPFMMDPASAIIGISSGAATLVMVVGQTVQCLIDLCDSYRNARLNLLDLVTNLQAFKTAWA